MGWFKKKSEEESILPELPELPSLDSAPSAETKNRSLPSLDSSPEPKPLSSLPSLSKPIPITPKEEPKQFSSSNHPAITQKSTYIPNHSSSSSSELKRSVEMSKKMLEKPMPFRPQPREFPKDKKEPTLPPAFKKNEPIFVRIDKFELALESIKDIKKKIEEMESLLTNLRQVNAKEDLELSEWEKEINAIKGRIDSVDSELFGKLE
jgi:hypothetical protein